MMQNYFESMVQGIESKISENPHSPQARKKFVLEIARLGTRLYGSGQRIAWCGIAAPFDLLNAMGVMPCFVEFVGGMLSSTGAVVPLLEAAENAGYSTDTCAYHRAVIGATLQGLMPRPDFLIATSCPCTAGVATLESLSRLFKRDLFVLHIPQDNSENSVRYLADQIRDMVDFVSCQTGKTLRQDLLQEAIMHTNEARRIMSEAYRLAQHVPSPVRKDDLKNFGVVMALLFGTQAGVKVAQAYLDEFQNRIDHSTQSEPEEKYRILWIQNRIQFKNPLMEFLEKTYKTSFVIDELNDITWDAIDPEDPYIGLARRAISIPFNGPIEQRLAHFKKIALAYQIDGAINPCHWGCRQGTGARGLVESYFKELKIPVLNLEVDCVDPRNFAQGQLMTRIQAFFEMLEQGKQ